MRERLEAGRNFDARHRFDYAHNQVGVDLPGGGTGRLDGYTPGVEIVERKLTQLANVQETTARSYLQQLSKYEGATIARGSGQVPRNLRGTRLDGHLTLEVPRQTSPVPRSVIDRADELGITIRDIYGTIYD